ncbi:MAG: hypothetical protein VX000_09095, partial [Myxococcota bacterium]|nr:hypothetical protein [Myxococcota bacterium]
GAAIATACDDGPVPPPPHLVVLIDRSEHMQGATGDACSALDTALARYMDPTSEAYALRDKRTRIQVFLTGTPRHPGPVSMMTLRAADFMTTGGLEASRAARDAALARRVAARQDAVALCQEQARRVEAGSIHAAMAGLVADLAARCSDGQTCELLVYSDLYDTTEPWVCAQVYGERQLEPGGACPRSPLLAGPEPEGEGDAATLVWPAASVTPVTPAQGLTIRVCGVADSRMGSAALIGPRVATRRAAVWDDLFPGSAFAVRNHCELL